MLLDQQENSRASHPMVPTCQKSSVLQFLYQPGPKQVAEAQLDAFYMISPMRHMAKII